MALIGVGEFMMLFGPAKLDGVDERDILGGAPWKTALSPVLAFARNGI